MSLTPRRAFEPLDRTRLRFLGDPQIPPDGRSVAFVRLARPERVVTPADTGSA